MFVILFNMNRIRNRRIIIGLVLTAVLVLLLVYCLPLCERIRDDVYFLGRNMRGYSPKQIEEMLVARFAEWQQDPVEAHYIQERQVVVPELLGYRVNIEETRNRILTASPGESIAPVLETVYPEVVMADYPAAFIERGNPRKNEVALMINVAWGSEFLQPMLEVLAAENAWGTFFVVGRWAQEHGPLIQEIASRGHELANHGHTDALVYTKLTPEEMENGLIEVNMLIEELTGRKPKYFTPHKGEYNQLLLEVVSRVGMRTVLWTVDTVDWQKPGVEKMKNKILQKLTAGGIILMHPTADTVIFLQETIPLIKQKGFAVVTVDDLLSPERHPVLFELSVAR
ncbi:MAG: polysaccharide deacetylase family protein [Bacillota bacterium]